MLELLKRWAQLEPMQCKVKRDREEKITSIVLGAVISAITAHPTLRYSLQNATDGTYASLRYIEDQSIAIECRNNEPAIALLTAYLKWLEARS